MTGPAGSGKSALQQTIAERCEESDILGSAYFFATADPTRNTVSNIVPTIAYQLGSQNPILKQAIDAEFVKKSLAFLVHQAAFQDTLPCVAGPLAICHPLVKSSLLMLPVRV